MGSRVPREAMALVSGSASAWDLAAESARLPD
jgi:hypothetical protein